ncbi:MAG: hypothetical protein Q9169_007332 [Polycauliona sp. 2 TL-2023]
MSRPEILVHAAAPSHGPDDVRYRKEALGILGFEVYKRHDVLGGEATACGTAQSSQTHFPQATQESPAQAQDSIVSTNPAPRHQVTDDFSTWVTPILPRPSPQILVGRTPAPLLLKRASGLASVQQTPTSYQRPRTAPAELSVVKETPLLRRSYSDAFGTPPSEVPDSQPTPRQLQYEEHSIEETSSPSPTHREEPHTKRWKGDDGEDMMLGLGDGTPPVDTSTPALYDDSQTSSVPPPANEPTLSPSSPAPQIPAYRRRKVDPPPPEVSTSPNMPSQLTSSLKILRQKCTRILQAVQPTRPIQDCERGYWRLTFEFDDEEAEDDKGWNHSSREKMWTWLESFIARGCGGWGVWATFEEGKIERFDGEDGWIGEMGDQEPVMGSEDETPVGRIKVFCWGEVVLEIYALLFLATDRKVKRCGAQWIDYNGDAVVVVGGN